MVCPFVGQTLHHFGGVFGAQVNGSAEDWCSEAMHEEAINYLEDILGDSVTANELRKRKNQRPSFWSLSLSAAKVLDGRITKPYPGE